ncbi:glycosyltransferase family 4 protein [Robiginitalea sp. M366]|uniref:glycosyltransferase family 4 protein n=1 Tax=Robiginitalea aestuariiviva TaxID=3036903 RepID=UPI00240D94D8|nr:glycosyltransferase family 4 protein [Robiginitalea aestuariiviva]MDG1572735.1 glycosyltransferase family 4 protein [Robiginitalea aestuariiviva]
MHILFLIDQVYLHGGIERVLSIKANYLAAQSGYRVSILTSEQKDQEPCFSFDDRIQFTDLGINYHRHRSYFHPANLLKVPAHTLRLKNHVRRMKPDVLVVCSHSTDTFFVPLVLRKTPTVKEFHFSKWIEKAARENPGSWKKKAFLQFGDYVQKKYSRLVVLNPEEATYFFSDNVEVIPNPTTFFPETLPQSRKPLAMAAGRIAPVKGFEDLLHIWALIRPQAPEWELHIYGDGEAGYVDTLKQLARDLGLNPEKIFKGKTNRVKDKMAKASLYFMTSRNECFPLVLLEAQACGLPVVSYDCPHGPRNILTPESGILIPMDQQAEFADKALELIRAADILKAMGKAARDNVKKFKVAEVMPLWTAMFHKLVQKS